MNNPVEKKVLKTSAASTGRMEKLRKYVVVACLGFCTLAFMPMTVSLAAENVAGESSAKDEALETFIKFSGALPERFDAGVTITYYFLNENQTHYLRIKKDGESALFCGDSGTDPSVLTRESIGDLTSYRSIHSKFDNIHWQLLGKYLTTWTNKNIPSEKDNKLALYFGNNGAADIRAPLLFQSLLQPGFRSENYSWKDANHFSLKLDSGEDHAEGFLTRDSEGRIIEQKLLFKKPEVNLYTLSKKIYNLGLITRYAYEKDMGVPFLPSGREVMGLDRIVLEDQVEEKTYKASTLVIDHLDLNPTFAKEDFVIELPPESIDEYELQFVSGPDIVRVDKESGQLEKIFASEKEIEEYQEKQKNRFTGRRVLYAFLILGIAVCIPVLIRISRKQ